MLASDDLDLGLGVYSLAEAAEVIRRGDRQVTARRLRSWLDKGLTPALRTGGDELLVTFHDLVSLEVIRRLNQAGASIQKIRKTEEQLRRLQPGSLRPFATHVFFTDGVNVWAEIGGATEEIVGRRANHLVWQPAIKTFADEIRFGDDGEAVAWDIDDWVEIDPRVQFGAPVVRGTRIPVATIRANLAVGNAEEVAEWYGLSVRQVRGVADYLQAA